MSSDEAKAIPLLILFIMAFLWFVNPANHDSWFHTTVFFIFGIVCYTALFACILGALWIWTIAALEFLGLKKKPKELKAQESLFD